ncbi:hypothetical protein PSN45_004421 [Yamadazyma tenuis]|uniref:DNase I-like protein n=1 Tax=Candida tenuis (strain ATCC 10573 / BCRC 21748 / CBS 615 / JCM 9827 / NBRC 10315 / NRRL Y-1498 / VKM Y-70) TaxID=590646 RepID=G3B5U0_CANTC|nr:DNase I-like protein [Yamadazyma tenuis ATCC 10573]XP_006687419.1 uncharacterized protein CANTEDRAFT_114600 [Yamadazyma tenuis ATCC 10573]EGV63625.1 DNase I-like protein [Yamadazyma tenuis ATCC 10573]EGV63626.1 hypothetical protein CANTEDRAFT_114600 [Yamadazyma tenuis ATCC 10573]WEJ96876.1 hypothetical protein PSN45_004421 [Yamadazyma tenuis]
MSSRTDTPKEIELDLFLFTHNCGKRGIDSDVFIPKVAKILPKEVAGLYVFGIEEACSIMDASSYTTSNPHFIAVNQVLLDTLHKAYGMSDTKFHTVGICHIGAIGIFVITPFPSKITKVRSASMGCGYFYSSMKGAAGLRVTWKPSETSGEMVDLTFADAHLSAYEGEYYCAKRNYEVIRLMRALDFGDGYSFLKPNSHSFFMGDLNYRTTKDIRADTSAIEELTSLQDQTMTTNSSTEELVQKYDELSESIRNDQVFMGFTEACIDFPPTYKFNLGTAIYNTKRSPSWCDRILYQSTYRNRHGAFKSGLSSSAVPRVKEYNSVKALFTSDHQPVYLSISIPFEPPESIISSSGYLKILPNDQGIDHFHRKNSNEVIADSASGPTQIYGKSTKLDRIIRFYLTPLSDSVIGNGLWVSTTPSGRIAILVGLLLLVAVYQIFK